jgi:hypothetical protein
MSFVHDHSYTKKQKSSVIDSSFEKIHFSRCGIASDLLPLKNAIRNPN